MIFKLFYPVSLLLDLVSAQGQSEEGRCVVSANKTILQNVQALACNQTMSSSMRYLSLLLSVPSNCTNQAIQILNSTNSQQNITFFAPDDVAFESLNGFNTLNYDAFRNCNFSVSQLPSYTEGGNFVAEQEAACDPSVMGPCNGTAFRHNTTAHDLIGCFPWIFQYHMLNESIIFTSETFLSGNQSMNITVLPTMLNSSCLVKMSNETLMNATSPNNQFVVLNVSTASITGSDRNSSNFTAPLNATIYHGINPVSNVTLFNIQCSNGVVHVVNRLLIPPSNVTDTLLALNATSSANFNSAELNMTGYTLFLPEPMNGQEFNASSTNLSHYIFPGLIFNNFTAPAGNESNNVFLSQNFTNLAGENITFLYGANYTMFVNETVVTRSNIVFDSGVLHFINGTLGAGMSNSTTSVMNKLLERFKQYL